MDLKEQHDELLAGKPSGVEHDADTCPLCISGGGDMSNMTYTEEDVKAAVAEALAPIQAELDMANASKEAEAVQAQIEAALAPIQAEIASLQSALDTVTLRAEMAEKNYDDLVAYLEAETKSAEEAAALAVRRDERIATVKEVASFTDEYIAKSIDRWIAMADEDFTALLDDWKAVSAKKELSPGDILPTGTAMTAARDGDSGDQFAEFRELSRMGRQGIDIRTL